LENLDRIFDGIAVFANGGEVTSIFVASGGAINTTNVYRRGRGRRGLGGASAEKDAQGRRSPEVTTGDGLGSTRQTREVDFASAANVDGGIVDEFGVVAMSVACGGQGGSEADGGQGSESE